MKAEEEFLLFSDGGSDQGQNAAGACIVRLPQTNKESRIIVYLGPGTNNEAEISAGLAGFSLLQVIGEKSPAKRGVRWLCDSEYTLKSATSYIHAWQKNGWKTAAKSPVKNQGLWRAFLALSADLSITPEHVYGHSGHVENELCDAAVCWARSCAAAQLESCGEGLIEPSSIGQDGWLLIDGRQFIAKMRAAEFGEPEKEACSLIADKLRALGVSWVEVGNGSIQRTAKNHRSKNSTGLETLQSKLKDAYQFASQLPQRGPELEEITAGLAELLQKCK